ncbi:hypothetical protein ACSQ0A_005484, partial [Escherichia coli]
MRLALQSAATTILVVAAYLSADLEFPIWLLHAYEYELLHFIRLSFASQCGMGALSVPAPS